MEDIINALLDVVRAQHSATEGTDETPFNMDDIVDMAMNLLGRPDEKEEEDSLVDSIQKMVVSLAPDIFPPKTFEEMDDSEKVLSASSMIEKSLMRNQNTNHNSTPSPSAPQMNAYSDSYSYEEDDEEEEQSVGDLNDIIYKSFMEMMGASTPQVEYPFDRSQIRYGREKSVTEMLQEEEEEKKKEEEAEAERRRKLSAWELAQNAIDTDEAAHAKEPYVPAPVEQPKAKSASQMAAEAIRQSEERDRMQLEIERQAEALMAEARRRGQDPMKFMLHQQEILQYMEKNSDELVSFEDYEDLSPEEKLEIERQIHIEKQIAEGVAPDQVDDRVPEEYIPEELKGKDTQASTASGEENDASSSGIPMSTFDEDTLRALSQQVVSDNSAMILGENSEEDMEAIQMEIFENLKRMMAGAGTEVPPEDIGQLLAQAAENSMANETKQEEESVVPEAKAEAEAEKTAESSRPLSAVELAMAAQKAAKPEPKEERNTISAADLAKAAQESAKKSSKPGPEASGESVQESQVKENLSEESPEDIEVSQDDLKDDMDDVFSDIDDALSSDFALEEEDEAQDNEKNDPANDSAAEEASSIESMEEEEYEYVDPDELVLGEHTQAEIDEAMENLNTLGLEGEVYERAKRMILLELAGSEAALDAWLFEQENGKKKKACVSAVDEENLDDLSDFDEDLFEKELEMAMDEDFDEEISEDIEDDFEESKEESEEEEPEEFEEEILEEEEFEEEDFPEDPIEESKKAEETGESDSEEAVEKDDDSHTKPEKEGEAEPEEEIVVEDIPKPSHKKDGREKQSRTSRSTKGRKSVVHKKEKTTEKKEEKKYESSESNKKVEERGYQVSVRKPFVLKNSTSYMDKFEEFITESQENRKLSTGFKKLDSMLRFGLHKGSYFIDAQPQYLKNSFMQQIADRAAEGGVDVLYISTELSRYDLMVDTISRLSYEINGQDPEKAYSVMSIMTGEDGATLECLEDELNWYRGRISEHLFILDQEAVEEYMDSMEDPSAAAILEELIRSIVTEGAHKPVVFIDNIENILSVEDSEDMKPLMEGMKKLAKELGIPIVMSYGYSQAESEEELSIEEIELHESIGNMCDVYLELKYADMITEDGMELTEEDIREMVEDGEKLLIDVLLHRNRRAMRASCQIQGTPRYNYFEE